MTERNRQYLKQEFQDGERPSGTDFSDLMDSFLNIQDDGVSMDNDSNLLLSRGLRLGNSASTEAGSLRFNGATVQFYDQGSWVDIAGGGGGAFQPVGGSADVAYGAGNVGIGSFNSPPTYRLEVDLGENTTESDQARFGNLVCSSGSGSLRNDALVYHRNHSTSSNYALRQRNSGEVRLNAPDGQRIRIEQNGNRTRLGITTTGHVVVGSNNDLPNSGAAVFQVNGDAFKNTGSSTWLISSDINLKEDIRDYEAGLEQLLQVRPVRFRYNAKAGSSVGLESVGIIGQEIEKIFPDMVRRQSAGASGPADDADPLLYDSSPLTYVLVNSIKELAGKVEKLQEELQAAMAIINNGGKCDENNKEKSKKNQ